MIYKLLLVKNRMKEKLDFSKCVDWFKKNLNMEVQIEEMKTDFDLTTAHAGNNTWKGVVVGNLPELLRPVVPEGKYNAIVFVYSDGLDGIRVSCCNGADGRQNHSNNTEILQVVNTTWQTLNHEMFHAFFYKAKRFGAPITDNMDTYFRDGVLDLNDGPTNRTIALQALAPYWDIICRLDVPDTGCTGNNLYSTMTGAKCPQKTPTVPAETSSMPTATLVRGKSGKHETLGVLTAKNGDATFTCKTLELPWLDNRKNISCIPPGKYLVKKVFWLRKLKYYYQVQNVPGRSGIFIHEGNYYFNYEGCIGLGSGNADINKDGEMDITNTVATIKAFEGFMQNKDFILEIK